MDLINNLSIRNKLYILIGSTSILMVVIGLIGLTGINQSKSALSSVYNEKLLRIILLNEVRNQQSRVRAELQEAGQLRDGFEILEHIDKVRSGMFKIETSLTEYNKSPLQDDEKKLMDDFVAKRMEYGRNGVLPIIDLLQAEKFEQASRLSRDIMIPGFSKASDAIDALIKLQEEGAKSEYERIEKITRLIRIIALIGIVAGLAISILLGIVITRSVSCGVREISNTAKKLANGELHARVNWNSKDELGDVGRIFNQMATEFSGLINQVRNSANQVTIAAQDQTSTAEQVSEISGSQTRQAEIAARSIENLNDTVKVIAQNTQDVVTYVNNASNMAEEGQQVVNRAVLGIQQVALTVKESTELIASLGQRSDQIGQIINVIKDIAEQTNLLALNAAIEAARAGEQGRGFAVVADEVRKLAERTSTATAEISEMITAIQSETSDAVITMEKGNHEVNEGVALANQAGEALNNINTSVKRVVGMIEQISVSTRTQSESTNEITSRVEHMADMARQNTGLIEKTTEASRKLNKLSGNLQQVVSHFKL